MSDLLGGVAGSKLNSEFAGELLQWIGKTLYTGLYASTEESLQGLFDSLNGALSSASRQITKGPKLWNDSAYSTVQGIAENVCIPIAAVFITVVFCWELIHLVQESNNMNMVKPERLLIVLLKFGLCLFVCAYSFKLVMGICDLGMWAGRHLDLQPVGVHPYYAVVCGVPDLCKCCTDSVFNMDEQGVEPGRNELYSQDAGAFF